MGEGSFLQILKKECDGRKSYGEGLVVEAQQSPFVLKNFERVADLIWKYSLKRASQHAYTTLNFIHTFRLEILKHIMEY